LGLKLTLKNKLTKKDRTNIVAWLNILEGNMRTCTEESLGRLIYQTAQDIRNMAEKILYPYDLTVEQMHLLKNMSVDAGITQKALGETVNKTPANLTRILDRLEMKTLIVRRPDSGDKREKLVFLTDRGMSLVEDVHETFQLFSARMLGEISEETQQQVRSCLQTMGKNIEQMTLELKKDVQSYQGRE
jgi:DNA-binding MarR family transcriptional regulator